MKKQRFRLPLNQLLLWWGYKNTLTDEGGLKMIAKAFDTLYALKFDKTLHHLEIFPTTSDLYDSFTLKQINITKWVYYGNNLYLSDDLEVLKEMAKKLKGKWIESAEEDLLMAKNTKLKVWDKYFKEPRKEEIEIGN